MFFERSPRMPRCTEGGSCAWKVGQQPLDLVGHFDGVAARLPHDRQVDAARAFVPYSLP